eukprot:g11590.t1
MAPAGAGAGGPHQLESLLTAFTNPDNEVRRRAEAAWEDLKQQLPDEVLENVCIILRREDGEAGEAVGLRAMAAVLLRTLFDVRSDVWFRVQERTQIGVKAALLDRLTKEPVAHIRRKLTHAIGQLAGISAGMAEWPELMTLTVALCDATQQSPEMKVVGLDLVNILAEFCPGMMAPHRAGLLQMFGACLDDAYIGVRVAALKAACSFLQDALPGPSGVAASSLVPKMMSVLEATVNSGDEGAAGDVLEALNVIAANQPLLLLGDRRSLDMVGSAMLSLAASPTLEDSTRELSLEVITGLCESAPSVLREGGGGIVGAVVPLIINMLALPPGGHDDEEELGAWLSMADGGRDDGNGNGDGDDLSMVSASALSRISIALGGQAVLSSAMPVCSEFLQDASSWRRRKAGLLTLLLIGEGCGEDLADSGLLPGIVLGPVLAGIRDEHPRVRYAALACVGQMTEDFGAWDGGSGEGEADDEGSFQGTFHSQLLPVLVESLGGPNANMPRLQAAAAGAVITFCNPERLRAEWLYEPAGPPGSSLGQEAVGLVLLRSLAGLVPPSGSSCVVVREEALTAVGIVSQVLGPGFRSFYGTFVPLAKEIIFAEATPTEPAAGVAVTPSEDLDVLRGKAMEAIALMGQAVGLEVFREDAHQVIRLLLNEQKTVARDPANPQSTYTLQALARMAGVLGEEFLPYLSEAVTPLLSALSTDAEIKLSNAPDADAATREFEAAGLTAMAMDLRGVGRQVFGVNTSLMQAKESACKTLYQYTEDLGEGFAPHAAATLSVVLPNLGPKNAVGVQVVSAALVPRLVGLAARRAEAGAAAGGGGGGGGAGVEWVREAQTMLDASVDALTEMVSRLGGDGGRGGRGGGSGRQEEPIEKGDQERACVVADSLSNLLEGRCANGGDGGAGVLGVSDERLSSTVYVLRDVAAASIRRTRSRLAAAAAASAEGLGGMTGAVDAAELAELEEGEEEMLVSVVDATGWMIKGRKAAFLPTFEAVMRPLVLPLLDSTAAAAASLPSSHRSFALCMAIDVLEHTGEGGRRAVFPEPLLPALLQGCREDEAAASTRQACAYGLGVASELGGPEFDAHSAEALRLLLALVAQGRAGNAAGQAQGQDEEDDDPWENGAVTDNAISAAFRVLFARPGPVCAAFAAAPMSAVVGSLLDALPIVVDVDEAHVCHRRVVDHALSRHELFFGGGGGGDSSGAAGYAVVVVPKLVTALAGMMRYQPSPQEEAAAGAAARGSQEELWARQLVDKETRQKAEEVLVGIKGAYPKVFEDTWAGLGEELRRALQTATAEICARAPAELVLRANSEVLKLESLGATSAEPKRNAVAQPLLSLHGLETQMFKLVALGATSEQWAGWLEAPLQYALAGGRLELADALRAAGGTGTGEKVSETGWNHPYPRRTSLQGLENDIFRVMASSGREWADWLRVPLEHAAARGNLELVDALLGAGANGGGGWRGCRGRTLLDAAALGGSAEVVSALVAAGAGVDVNVVSVSSRRSALYTATFCGHESCARRLVQAGADVNFRDPLERCYVLHWAVEGGLAELVDDMLAAGADIGAREGDDGLTALHVAAYVGHEGLLSTLLQSGADKDSIDNDGDTPLILAAIKGHLPVTKALLAAGADVRVHSSETSDTALHCAANGGHRGVLSALLLGGADKDARNNEGDTPLTLAAFRGHSSIVDDLLAAGANVDAVDKRGDASLAWATTNGYLPVVETLLAAGADYNIRNSNTGRTAVHDAAAKGHADVLTALLRSGADKDAVDNQGRPPLIEACIEGHLRVVEALLEAGADVSPRSTVSGRASLHFAAIGNHSGILCALLLSGADKDVVDNFGDTPLALAAHAGHLSAVEYLLAAGARRDTVDNEGKPPLIGAAMGGHLSIVKALLTGDAGNDDGCGATSGRHDGNPSAPDNDARFNQGRAKLSPAAFRDLLSPTDDPPVDGASVDAVDARGNSSLMFAATNGHLPVVKALLEAGADINIRCLDVGYTAIHYAAWYGHVEVLFAFLRSGADKDTRDNQGRSPLIYAAIGGNLSVLESLLEAGADVNVRGAITGGAALHFAVDGGHDEIVRALLQGGADKDGLDNNGDSPLTLASCRGHLSIVQTLLAAGADVHARSIATGRAAIYRAAGKGHDEIVRALLQKGADKDVLTNNGTTPLWKAAAKGHLSVVVTLVAAGADVTIASADGSVPLHHVAGAGDADIVFSLLRKGADVDALDNKGRSPLAWAAKHGHLLVVERLLAAGADVNLRSGYDGSVPLHHAAMGGHDRILAALLFQGADKDALDMSGKSPLIWATRAGRQVEALLAAGAQVDTRSTDFLRYSALDWAVREGDVRAVESLIRHGADLESCSFGGHSALHMAAVHGQTGAVQALVRAGANMERKTDLGHTPLLCACRCITFDTLIALLEHGAAVNVSDVAGDTPLHWLCRTQRAGLESVMDLLLLREADETFLNNQGHAPADLLDIVDPLNTFWVPYRTCTEEEKEGARRRLASASADRAWARRCWLVMLRSRELPPDRGAAAGDERVGGVGSDGELGDVVELLVGMASDDLFRTTVGFL